MATGCSCDVTLNNTGTQKCKSVMDVAVGGFMVPLYKTNGDINEVDLSTVVFNKAFFDGKTQNADKTQRWYPVGDFEAVEDTRAENVVETAPSGKVFFVQQGIRSFKADIFNGSTDYMKQLEASGCTKWGFLPFDKQGNLIYSSKKAGFLRPIAVDNNSFSATLVKATDTTLQKLKLNWQWSITENDSDLRFIKSADISYSVFDVRGLVDIYGAPATSITTTGFQMDLNTNFSDSLTFIKAKGLVIANFVLFNVTDNAAVTLTSVTESPDGHYAFVFPAQTSADVLRLSVALTTGYDSTVLAKVAITIP